MKKTKKTKLRLKVQFIKDEKVNFPQFIGQILELKKGRKIKTNQLKMLRQQQQEK